MLSLVINIIVILLLLFFLYIGWYAGIIKSFFAVAAGFFAIILAQKYPYQAGINYYFVFIATAVIIFIIGLIIFKIVKFLYLSLFDKIAGVCFGVFLWFVLSANFVIPVLNKSVYLVSGIMGKVENKVEAETASYILNLSSKSFPAFGRYVPEFLRDKNLKKISKNVSQNIKNINENIDTIKEFVKEAQP